MRKIVVALIAALLTIVITQENILKLGIFQRLELAALDYRFQVRGKHPSIPDSSDIIIVEVSDESFKSLPSRWPWPRSYYAHLVRNLKAAGAKVVAIDIILEGPDAYSRANDDSLRAAIRETGIVVLAGKLEAEHERYQVIAQREQFGNLFYPIDSALGLVNIRNDADGVYRRYSPYWERVQQRDGGATDTLRIPTLSFAVLNSCFGQQHDAVASSDHDSFTYLGAVIPKYDPSSMLINFYGPSGAFPRVKFADVIDDATLTTNEEAELHEQINTFSDPQYGYLHDDTFKGKIVLVGSTTPEDHDLFPVSVAQGSQHGDNLMYGVEIHANVIQSVLRNEFISRQPRIWEALTIILFALLTFFLTSAIRGGRSRRHFMLELLGVVLVVVEIVVIGGMSIFIFVNNSYIVPAISPITAVIAGYVASTAYHYVAERKQRLMIKGMFSTYVNPTVVDHLIANPDKLTLGGERKQLTVLFSDIEGFTALAEHMQPEALVSLLNDYLSRMAEIVFKHSGTLDKYEGDAVMAFWGAPVDQKDHAVRACFCALEMQRTLDAVRSNWKAGGPPQLTARIGINSGEMIVGNMGGKEKFDYTVIGDGVNIASRLEGANRFYRTAIMIGESTHELVKDVVVCRELDFITVHGRTMPLRTFELIGAGDESRKEWKEFLILYHEGLRLYRSRLWNEADQAFTEALKLRPNDFPAQFHLERIHHFRQFPPPDNWSGVVEMTMK
ncbi:MAG: adenylate/guanylate cyclase domain-containing protein [Ignavibacteriae bacterium]|nr:adenylate/guanylate cyclase domain-containing protein [Ignavibacteriota bacterium]